MIPDSKKNIEIMKLVFRFMAPFAVALVLLGVVFGRPGPRASIAAVSIVFLTAVANLGFVKVLDKFPERAVQIRKARVGFNYAFNLCLIYLLLPYWHPIWMLLLLTMIAVGIYEDQEATFTHAALFTAMLFYVASRRQLLQGVFIGEVGTYCLTLWVVGLFVNRLAVIESRPPAK